MFGDKICFDGDIVSLGDVGLKRLACSNFLYQKIHTRSHLPLYLVEHIEVLDVAMRDMYGCHTNLCAEQLKLQIGELLRVNHYPKAANVVMIRVYPPEPDELTETFKWPHTEAIDCPVIDFQAVKIISPSPELSQDTIAAAASSGGGFAPPRNLMKKPLSLLSVDSQLLYPRFTLWHSRALLIPFPCEYLFMGYPSAASLATTNYALNYARGRGANQAVFINSNKVLTNVGDEPLFVAINGVVIVSPAAEGSADSVMRRLIISACRAGGIELIERPITKDIAIKADEMFYPTPQGITSVRSWEGKSLFTVVAGRIVDGLGE